MCLTTDNPEIRIATEDIYVFKMVHFAKRSFWEWLFRKPLRANAVHRSDHLYIQGVIQPTVEVKPAYQEDGGYTEVRKGYHSHVYHKLWESNALFMIPKGTKYMQGYFNGDTARHNYVSESIVFVGKL